MVVTSLYQEVGRFDVIFGLVERFYERVEVDDVLRRMYPEDDLAPARERMTAFLVQHCGGPRSYSRMRGHPRLRMRHAGFDIDTDARDRWLAHMRYALDDLQLAPSHDGALWT